MAAVIVRGGAVLSLAVNLGRWGHHAEIRALQGVKDARGSTVFVVHWKGKCSKPCANCQAYLKEAGVKKAVYFDLHGQVVEQVI